MRDKILNTIMMIATGLFLTAVLTLMMTRPIR